MTNAFATCSGIFDDLPSIELPRRARERTRMGLEILMRRSFSKRIGGWISYTLSRSTVDVPHPLRNEPSEVPSNFDRPHVFNAALAFDFGKGWHAGARFTYYTGLPYTQTANRRSHPALQRLSPPRLLAHRHPAREALATRGAWPVRPGARRAQHHVQQRGDRGDVPASSWAVPRQLHAPSSSAP